MFFPLELLALSIRLIFDNYYNIWILTQKESEENIFVVGTQNYGPS
jgi:hypothetical protein